MRNMRNKCRSLQLIHKNPGNGHCKHLVYRPHTGTYERNFRGPGIERASMLVKFGLLFSQTSKNKILSSDWYGTTSEEKEKKKRICKLVSIFPAKTNEITTEKMNNVLNYYFQPLIFQNRTLQASVHRH